MLGWRARTLLPRMRCEIASLYLGRTSQRNLDTCVEIRRYIGVLWASVEVLWGSVEML